MEFDVRILQGRQAVEDRSNLRNTAGHKKVAEGVRAKRRTKQGDPIRPDALNLRGELAPRGQGGGGGGEREGEGEEGEEGEEGRGGGEREEEKGIEEEEEEEG